MYAFSLPRFALALLLAGTGLATSAQAQQRLAPEEAEELGLSPAVERTAPSAAARGGLQVCVDDVLLVPDASLDGVATFDPQTGDLVDPAFIVDPTHLSTPKSAIANFDGDGVFVADQIGDAVFEYDCQGNFVRLFAPAGGVNTAILDNIRGIAISRDGTQLWVTVGSGTNRDAVAAFDQSGNFVGNFIAPGTGLDSPFDVLLRLSDVLVSNFTGGDNVLRYDYSGGFLGVFEDPASPLNLPEQLALAANNNVLAAGFSTPSGVYEFDASGTQVGVYNAKTGLRGVYELPNGNLLVTNGSGISQITRANTVVRDSYADADQYIELFAADAATCEQTLDATLDNNNPAPGQTVTFNVTVTNNSPSAAPLDLWLAATGPVSGRVRLASGNLPGNATVTRNVRFRVPSNAPSGMYAVDLNIGDFSMNDICDTVTFPVTVSSARVAGNASDTEFTAWVEGDFFESEAASRTAVPTVTAGPNPFRGQTTIRYEVAEASEVRLAVYDVLGRTVAVLADGQVEAGQHAATFDARGLAAGTYVYRLQVGQTVETGRLTVLY